MSFSIRFLRYWQIFVRQIWTQLRGIRRALFSVHIAVDFGGNFDRALQNMDNKTTQMRYTNLCSEYESTKKMIIKVLFAISE